MIWVWVCQVGEKVGVTTKCRDASQQVKNNEFFQKNLILGIQSDLKEARGYQVVTYHISCPLGVISHHIQ